MKTKLDYALKYSKRGLAVFPLQYITSEGKCSCRKGINCTTSGKHPITKHGFKDATTNSEQIEEWWGQFPEANIGIATGKISGIVVIDIDPRNGGNESFEELCKKYGTLPETYEILTGGGGRHLYYKYPDYINIVSKLGSGIDIKADGGYVVAPPSNHISGGSYIRKINSSTKKPIELPPKWIRALNSDNQKLSVSKFIDLDKNIIEGERNNTLYKLASSFRTRGLEYEEILASIKTLNKNRCVPPLSEKEVEDIVTSSIQHEPGIDWAIPEPLKTINLPEFPIGCLPRQIQQYVRSVSESILVPFSMPACVVISAFSMACTGKIIVSTGDGHEVNPNIYIMVSAETGTRKSSVFKEVMRPVEEFENTKNKELSTKINEVKNKLDLIDKKIDSLKKGYAKGSEGQRLEYEEKIIQLEKEKDEITIVNLLTLYTQDVTPEKLTDLLQKNNEKLGIMSSEGELIEIWGGRYDNTASIDPYLKGFTGDPLKVHRMGRGEIKLKHPLLTLLIMAQPIIIEKALSNASFDSRGLVPRFLYCKPKDMVGTRHKLVKRPIPDEVKKEYYSYMKRLLSQTSKLKTIKLNNAANKLYLEVEKSCDIKMAEESGTIRAWGLRKPEFILKVSGILHIMKWLESKSQDIPNDIDADTFKNAIAIINFFELHSYSCFENMGYDQSIAEAKIILSKIKNTKKPKLSHNQIFNLCRGQNRFKEAKSIDRGLDILCDKGYLRKLSSYSTGPGRPRGDRYKVNPNI